MGVYKRATSPFWWMYLEGVRTRASTGVPLDGGSPMQDRENRRQAQAVYSARMTQLARQHALATTVPPGVAVPLQRSLDGWCYVYFVQVGDAVKIGRAIDMQRRLKTIQTTTQDSVTLLAAVPAHANLEHAIHDRFRHLQQRGEWFTLAPELATFVERVRDGANPVALLW